MRAPMTPLPTTSGGKLLTGPLAAAPAAPGPAASAVIARSAYTNERARMARFARGVPPRRLHHRIDFTGQLPGPYEWVKRCTLVPTGGARLHASASEVQDDLPWRAHEHGRARSGGADGVG